MKILTLGFLFLFCISGSAQQYSVRKTVVKDREQVVDTAAYRHIWKAGHYQQKAIAFSIGTAAFTGVAALCGAKYAESKTKGLVFMSAVSGVAAVASAVIGIRFQWKSGKELKLAAGELVFRF